MEFLRRLATSLLAGALLGGMALVLGNPLAAFAVGGIVAIITLLVTWEPVSSHIPFRFQWPVRWVNHPAVEPEALAEDNLRFYLQGLLLEIDHNKRLHPSEWASLESAHSIAAAANMDVNGTGTPELRRALYDLKLGSDRWRGNYIDQLSEFAPVIDPGSIKHDYLIAAEVATQLILRFLNDTSAGK